MLGSRIVIASVARTPITKFGGSFQSLSATQLGATAIRGALDLLADYDLPVVREAYMGNVVSAGLGQAPARQAVKGAGLPDSTICTTINKVCASGMKSVMLAAQTLQASPKDDLAMIAGGMESMSNIPRYLKRTGQALGHLTVEDGLIHDGLWDVYNDQHMGMCGEKCAKDFQFSREDQDAYTIASYERARTAVEADYFSEVVPVEVSMGRKGTKLIAKDEEPFLADLERLASLKPAFDRKSGSVTAGNASSLNDGAAALVLMTEEEASRRGIPAVARILGWGDAEQDPVDFTTTPSLAVPVALEHAGLSLSDIDYHEINEAFAVVALYVFVERVRRIRFVCSISCVVSTPLCLSAVPICISWDYRTIASMYWVVP
jgi:acetyl-CoA C-acetyltransferase